MSCGLYSFPSTYSRFVKREASVHYKPSSSGMMNLFGILPEDLGKLSNKLMHTAWMQSSKTFEEALGVAPFSGPTRLADSNRIRDARLILFVYFSFVFLFLFFFCKSVVTRIPSPTQMTDPNRSPVTPTIFIYLIKTFYLCHFVLGFSIMRKHFKMVGP